MPTSPKGKILDHKAGKWISQTVKYSTLILEPTDFNLNYGQIGTGADNF